MSKVGCLAYRRDIFGKVEKDPVGVIIKDQFNQYGRQYLVLLDKNVSGIGWTAKDCSSDDHELIGKYITDKSNRYWFFTPIEIVIKNKMVLKNE